MMRRADPSRGLVLCFVLNLVLNFEWGVAAAVLLVLNRLVHLPGIFALLVFIAWVVLALVLTLLVNWGNHSASAPTPPQTNKNPYSARNEDVFPPAGQKPPKDDGQ